MDKVRDIFSYFITAMTMFAFLGAIYQAFNGQKGTALTLGTLFLAGGLFVFLPQIEFFKVLGVEARLRAKVDEANAVLDKLKRLSAISARATYMQLAWANRLGAPSAKDKQAILDEVDAQLAELKPSLEEITTIKKPFVRMIAFDFYFLYTRTIQSYAGLRYSALIERARRSDTPENLEARDLHSKTISAWTARVKDPNPLASLENNSLESRLNRYSPKEGDWLDAQERQIAEEFKNLILRLNTDCEKKGGYTEEAANYYDKYNGDTERLAEDLFANTLSDLRRATSH